MKKGDILISSLFYAVYMLVSCIVVMCAEILILKLVNWFIVPSPLTVCVLRVIIYTVGVNAILAIAAYKEGYRAAYFSLVGTLISAVLATVMHFVFSLLFGFEAFASGAVKFISALIRFGSSLNSPLFVGKLDRFDMIPFFFINAAVYIAVMLIFGKLGEKNRLRDRKELTGVGDSAEN